MKCIKCGKKMIIRANKKDGSLFYGCKGYPDCTNTAQLTKEELEKRERQKQQQQLVAEKEFLPATIVKKYQKRFASKANHASYGTWVFFNKLGVSDVELICDTLLSFYELKGKSVQSLKNLDAAYLFASKSWDEFSRFSQKYVIENKYLDKDKN